MKEPIRFETVLDRFSGKGGLYFMSVPDDVAVLFVQGRKPERVRCVLNDAVHFQCAIRPMAGGGFYINVATQLRQQGKFVLGQKLSATVRKDDSVYGRDMPEELTELLHMDTEGNAYFEALLPSHQRGIIHYIDSAKGLQVRVDRAIKMINRLKAQKGKL